jgi:dTDP-4-dehydrorhamnose 3,5-epimerase and related enzymes
MVFVVLSEGAIFSYKVDEYFSAEHNEGIAYNDKDIAVDWLLPEAEIILSEVDQNNT